jgi:hypothetical protein
MPLFPFPLLTSPLTIPCGFECCIWFAIAAIARERIKMFGIETFVGGGKFGEGLQINGLERAA